MINTLEEQVGRKTNERKGASERKLFKPRRIF